MRKRSGILLGLCLCLLVLAVPEQAHADVGSTIVGRLWDSLVSTGQSRMHSSAPAVVKLLQEAEAVFLGQTEDITTIGAIQDVYKAMRVAGLLLLAFCTVISLAQLTESGMVGNSSGLMEWLGRFCVAIFMTVGGIHFYGLWIGIFNGLLTAFRRYLDAQWGGSSDASVLYTQLLPHLSAANGLLVLIFGLVTLVVLFVLWFLIGGIRMAEMALAVIIAPLVWPLYLIPVVDDIPKSAFRSFLGLNALLLLIVAMLRQAVRWVSAGGVATTVWTFVPAISLLMLTVFLPSMIKRLVGQGNTGAGSLLTAVSIVGGLKGVSMAASAGLNSAVKPPAAAAIPNMASGASAYPVAPISSESGVATSSPTSWPLQSYESTHATYPSLSAGPRSTPMLESGLYPTSQGPYELEVEESEPGSGKFDRIVAIRSFEQGTKEREREE